MNTLYINYTKTGKPISDHLVEENILAEADFCKYGQDKQFNVSTENMVNAARAMSLVGRITCNVRFLFEGEDIPMNEYGAILSFPRGFCDYNQKWLTEILSEGLKRYKERIENAE